MGYPADESDEDPPPEVIDSDPMKTPRGVRIGGAYRVIRKLGEGGMGIVVLAEDIRLERQVAVKLIRPDRMPRSSARTLFLTEARAMARVRHPNVVEIYAFGEHHGMPYFAMEYVPGCDLHDWLVQRRPEGLAVDEAIGFLEQICRGVQAIHDNGAVHQDLKPSNVLVGPGFRVVVTDLGLARVVDPTSPGVELTVGTPLYSAPEVILGHTIPPEHAARVDVYALGVIAYQLLTGCYMFPIDDTTQLLRYQTRSMPVPPSEVRLDLPERFDDVIFGALEKDPMLRIPTAAAFRQALMEAREVTERKAIAAPRIIVVDDDPGFRQWVTRVLQATVGYAEIIELDSGSQACDIARRFKASLMIAALELPELNGIELTAELRGDPATRDLPIVVTTAVGGAPDWKMLQSMGADGFLIKPFPDTALTGLVRQVLSVRRA